MAAFSLPIDEKPFRSFLRDGAAATAATCGLTAPRLRHEGRLLVVTLHRVLPPALRDSYPFPNLAVTPEELDWLLATLSLRYTLGPLAELHARHLAGERPAQPFAAITFDDGQLDNYEHALPVLARHGVRASFFVPVDAIDRSEPLWHDRLGFAALALRRAGRIGTSPGELASSAKRRSPAEREALVRSMVERAVAPAPAWAGMMSWRQVRALASAGHEIGSHSMSHPLLPQCDARTLRDEVGRSKARIEEELGAPVESFCYPDGDWDRCVAEAVRAAGYRRAVDTRWGSNAPAAPALALRRCDVDARRLRDRRGRCSSALLAFRLSGLDPRLE